MYVTSVLITSTVDPSKRYTRHVTLDGLHGALCRHTQEEPSGKKSSIGSENRQRCSRRFRTSVMVRSVPPRFDRVALKARRKNLAVCATLLRVVLCARRVVAARRSREEWVAYSFDRFIAAIKTRYTPHTRRHVLSHPTTGKTLS